MLRKFASVRSLSIVGQSAAPTLTSAQYVKNNADVAVSAKLSSLAVPCGSTFFSTFATIALNQRRYVSCCGMSGFTDVKYNSAADHWLDEVNDVIDGLCEEFPTINDVGNNGGVLTIDLGEHGTFILNKQAPKRQLWLSSPISGPSHYDMETEGEEGGGRVWWKCDKTGSDLSRLLEKELMSLLVGSSIELP